MVEHKLYDKFLEMFPQYKGRVSNYGHSANGHEVRITTDDHDILFFEYYNDDYWKLETAKSYVNFKSMEDKLEEMKRHVKAQKGKKNE